MKYEEPNIEIILIYDCVVTTSTGGLEWNEGEESGDSGSFDDLE